MEKALKENNIELKSISAVVGRCGGLPPVKSGAYLINEEMIDRLTNTIYIRSCIKFGCYNFIFHCQ